MTPASALSQVAFSEQASVLRLAVWPEAVMVPLSERWQAARLVPGPGTSPPPNIHLHTEVRPMEAVTEGAIEELETSLQSAVRVTAIWLGVSALLCGYLAAPVLVYAYRKRRHAVGTSYHVTLNRQIGLLWTTLLISLLFPLIMGVAFVGFLHSSLGRAFPSVEGDLMRALGLG